MALKIQSPFKWERKSDLVSNPAGPKFENKYSLAFFNLFKGFQSSTVDQKKLIAMSYRANADVFSTLGLITKRASQLPWKVYELKQKRGSTSAKHDYEAAQKSGDLYKSLKLKAQYWDESENTELNKLLECPNKIQSWPLFIREALGYKLLTGNRYIYRLRPAGMKKASQIFILPTHFMTVKLNEGSNYLERHNVSYVMDSDFNLEFSSDEVYHSKDWNPAMVYQDFIYGFSPIQAAKNLIEKSNDSYSASAFAYKNMGIAGIVSQGKEGGDDQFITPEEAKAIEKKLEGMVGGVDKFKKIIATSASISYQNLGLSPVDLAIIESQKMDREQIANIWNVPVTMLNSMGASTYDNMTQSERSFYLNCVIPELCDLRDCLNEWLLADFNVNGKQYYLDFDIKSIPALQADLAKLSERLLKEIQEGIISRNEYRKIADYEPFDNKYDKEDYANMLLIPAKYFQKEESIPPSEK